MPTWSIYRMIWLNLPCFGLFYLKMIAFTSAFTAINQSRCKIAWSCHCQFSQPPLPGRFHSAVYFHWPLNFLIKVFGIPDQSSFFPVGGPKTGCHPRWVAVWTTGIVVLYPSMSLPDKNGVRISEYIFSAKYEFNSHLYYATKKQGRIHGIRCSETPL